MRWTHRKKYEWVWALMSVSVASLVNIFFNFYKDKARFARALEKKKMDT
jgi:hypothetical protein